MNRTIQYILCALLVSVTLVSCSNDVTLQRYFVDNQERKNFISQNLPLTMLNMDESKLNEEQLKAYKSVKRLNFLGYKLNKSEIDTYNTELALVKTILQDEQYNELIEFSDRGRKVLVKYIGNDEEADEVILLGSSKDQGFAVVRILGDDMRPDKMYALVESLRHTNFDGDQFKGIANFFE